VFLRGHEINNYTISDNLATNLIIVFFNIELSRLYRGVAEIYVCGTGTLTLHRSDSLKHFLTFLYPGQIVTALLRPFTVTNNPVLISFPLLELFFLHFLEFQLAVF